MWWLSSSTMIVMMTAKTLSVSAISRSELMFGRIRILRIREGGSIRSRRACALPSTRRSCRRPIEKYLTKAEQQLPLSWRRWLPSNEVAPLRRVQLRTCPGYARFASGAAWPGISASVAQKFPLPPEARCS